MGKKIIRLTESDLIRIVKKVIREQEEWSDSDESELSSVETKYKGIKDRMMGKAKDIQTKYTKDGNIDYSNDFYDEIETMYNDPDYIETNKRRDDLMRRKSSFKEKTRYDDVVKNRPSDFDVEKFSSEYDELEPEIENLKKGHPYLKDSSDFDDFADKYEKFKSSDAGRSLKSKQDRRSYLGKHLDKDYTHPSWKNRK